MSNDPDPPSRKEFDFYETGLKEVRTRGRKLFLILQGIHATSIDALSDAGEKHSLPGTYFVVVETVGIELLACVFSELIGLELVVEADPPGSKVAFEVVAARPGVGTVPLAASSGTDEEAFATKPGKTEAALLSAAVIAFVASVNLSLIASN